MEFGNAISSKCQGFIFKQVIKQHGTVAFCMCLAMLKKTFSRVKGFHCFKIKCYSKCTYILMYLAVKYSCPTSFKSVFGVVKKNAFVVVWENQTVITVVSTNFVFVSDLHATADAVTLAVIKAAPPERKLCCGIREAEIQLSPRCQIVLRICFVLRVLAQQFNLRVWLNELELAGEITATLITARRCGNWCPSPRNLPLERGRVLK